MNFRAFEYAASQPWMITEEALSGILSIAQRDFTPDFEAVALKKADSISKDGVLTRRGTTGVIAVNGPIFRYANFFTDVSGATTIDALGIALGTALEDPKISNIVLNIDSPGGEIGGVAELAALIRSAQSKKKIVAFANDLYGAASAAYWIAASASEIVAGENSRLGSIGVITTIVDKSSEKSTVKTYQFVSSQSPNKRPDLATDAGRATIQQMVDDLAGVFVSSVAKFRGVTEKKVLSDFGQGGMYIASKAVAAGMADKIGTFEGLLASLEKAAAKSVLFPTNFGGPAANSNDKGDSIMENPIPAGAAPASDKPVDVKAIRSEAVASERARINSILTCDEATGREGLARTLALETDQDLGTAKKILAASPKAETKASAAKTNPFEEHMAGIKNPDVGTGSGDPAGDDAAATIASTLKLYQGGKQ